MFLHYCCVVLKLNHLIIYIYSLFQDPFEHHAIQCLGDVTTDPVYMVVSVQRDGTGRHNIIGHVYMVVSVQIFGTGRPSIIGPAYMVVSVQVPVGLVLLAHTNMVYLYP
jgi:hypothetical protein